MDEHLNKKQNEYDTIIENELKKIKLSLENWMDFSKSFISPDLPPETEGQFLDHVQKWENQYAQRKMTSVYNMAGWPSFKPISDIPDEEMSVALDEARELLNKHSIRVDTLCEVNDHELYRFITEGMVHCFTYEDFHPNHPYDIKNRCTELIHYIADNEREERMVPWGLADQITSSGQLYAMDEFNEHIIRFRKLFRKLTLAEFNYLSLSLNATENEATAIAFVHYSGMTDSGQTMELIGNCTFNLSCEYEWWLIHQLDIPWKIIA